MTTVVEEIGKSSVIAPLSLSRIEHLALSQLESWPHNPKQHATSAIIESIERFGFVTPLVVDENTGRLIAGHGRLEALIKIKAAGHPPPARVSIKDGDWLVPVLRGIGFSNEKEAEAYLVADNQTTIRGGWDEGALQALLVNHLDSLPGIGFMPSEIEALRMLYLMIWSYLVAGMMSCTSSGFICLMSRRGLGKWRSEGP